MKLNSKSNSKIIYNKQKFRFNQKLLLIEVYLVYKEFPLEEISLLTGVSTQLLTKVVLEWIKNNHFIIIESKLNNL